MDLDEATKLARAHVRADADVVHCIEPPPGIYQVSKPNGEFLFLVVPKYPRRVGGSDVIAVDRQSGAVRHAGISGE